MSSIAPPCSRSPLRETDQLARLLCASSTVSLIVFSTSGTSFIHEVRPSFEIASFSKLSSVVSCSHLFAVWLFLSASPWDWGSRWMIGGVLLLSRPGDHGRTQICCSWRLGLSVITTFLCWPYSVSISSLNASASLAAVSSPHVDLFWFRTSLLYD